MYIKNESLRNVLSLFVLVGLFLFSCENENDKNAVVPANSVSTEEIGKLKSFLVEATGTPLAKIDFDADNAGFIIDTDVFMTVKEARGHYAKFQSLAATQKQGRTEQRRYTFLMSQAVAATNTIYIDPAVPDVWVVAITQAIGNWNGTDTQIKAYLTTNAANARIVVSMTNALPSYVIAQASFPDAAGNSGPTVQINSSFNTSLSATRKQFAITHEFGHCFGFTHTNQTFGDVIEDTPVTDANSVMNSVVLDWNGYTFYDFIGYGVVYPNVAGTRRFLRYYNTGNGDHFYTIATSELGGAGSNGWSFEGSVGYIYTSQVSGTVSLYRYYNTSSGDHFYTTNFAELGSGGSGGWNYEGIAGYVSPTEVPGTKPLYRYFNVGNGDHFYTPNFAELGAGGGGWIYEGIQCYIW